MPFIEPSRSDVHVNVPLGNVSLAFMQEQDTFVAGEVFPLIPSDKRSNIYFTYDPGDFNRDEMQVRAPASESAGGSYEIDQATFLCTLRAFHKDVPDEVRDNQDDPLDQDAEATLYVTLKHLINREIRWATEYFTAGAPGTTWTFDVDGATSATAAGSFDPTDADNNDKLFWNLPASTPIEDIRQGKRFVQEETGFRPNQLTLARTVYDTLLDHPDIVGRIDRGQTVSTAIVNREALAALFELDRINVMDSIKNTAEKGATNDHNFIAGKHGLLSYRPPVPGRMTPSAGYTFTWTGHLGATEDGSRILRFRRKALKADRVEIESCDDLKLVSADLGYFFGAIIQ
jgi:hypothetical protein